MFSKKALQKLASRGKNPAAYLLYLADSWRESLDNLKAGKSLAGSMVRFSAGAQLLVLLALLPLFLPTDWRTWLELCLVTLLGTVLIVVWLLLHLSLIRDPSGWPVRLGPANKLTIARFLLIPPILFLLAREQLLAGMVVYAICAFTDVVDGWLARRRGEITEFGVVMDPLADIFSTAGVFAMLLWLGLLPAWVFVLLMVRYASLFLGAIIMFFTIGPLEYKATVTGKIVGVLQALAVIMIIVYTIMGGDIGHSLGPYLFPVIGLLFMAVIVSQLVLGIRAIKSKKR
jgi:cardiolipin synthase